MNIINDIFQNGSIWALVGTLLYVFSEFEPALKAHVRNEHAKSLLDCANRIVPSIMKIQEASPTDRKNEALAELNEFASKRNIPLEQQVARHIIEKAITDFVNNGGKIPEITNTIKSNVQKTQDDVNNGVKQAEDSAKDGSND